MRFQSIRSRTLGMALVLLLSASSVITWFSFNDAAHEVEELYDAHLAQQARLLGNLIAGLNRTTLSTIEKLRLLSTLEELSAQADPRLGHPYESKVVFQVWLNDQLILRSVNAPSEQLTDYEGGFTNERVANARWRVFVLPGSESDASSQERIIIAERWDVRGELVAGIALRSLLPELFGLPILAALLWWAIGRGLHPLAQLARQIRQREPHSLQPLPSGPLPTELDVIHHAINDLLAQLKQRLEREQQFIADAAHELRTPLSVLSLHTQNAIGSPDEADRQAALQSLQSGLDRTTRIVAQLLTLARLDPDDTPPTQPTDVLAVTRQELANLAPLAWRDGVDLLLLNEDDHAWQLLAEAGSVEILLQNLISNALRHGAAGKQIEIDWQPRDDGLELSVTDHGPGVADEKKPLLLQRFYRTGSEGGAGLGLSIVARIVERHQATLRLDDTPGGGLVVRILWPQQRIIVH
ncbi:ATP-binding protein [Saccharospirillum mangrovi]|uniref:ATP-binding protein n=1 Tax=Saccharospirillum mangrovi TaxID=2161747 RepID=UPI000D3AFB96|nr:ATP-binding protein [Saccharospirillum mangrovi]